MKFLKKCVKCIAKEFKWTNFGFEHPNPEDFLKSKWQKGTKSLPYLVFRWVLAIFFLGIFCICLSKQFFGGKMFIYLTNWGLTLCVLTNVLGAILVTQWYFNIGKLPNVVVEKSFESMTPKILKFYWLIHCVTLHLALVITTMYWAFIYGKQKKINRFPAISFTVHTFNTVFMVADFIAVGFPVRILHSFYTMMFPIFYCFCTVIYYNLGGLDECGNHFIYPILDWQKPLIGMTTFGGVFVLYCIFTILTFAGYHIKLFVDQKIQDFRKTHSNSSDLV